LAGADMVFDWRDIDKDMGDDAWIVSRKNAGLRIFGYLKAAAMGCDVIATLDDDCLPVEGQPLMQKHIGNLFNMTKWMSSCHDMTARGVPYRSRGELLLTMINMGLWRNVGDYDAPHSLVDEADLKHYEPPRETRIIPHGMYAPISTMSLAFRRAALPLMYLPLMGENSLYDRFDDIWGGIIAKKVCDRLGWHISIGEPIVHHNRASNPFVNLAKEAAGIGRNETFWVEVDECRLESGTPGECMIELAKHFLESDDPHTAQLGKAIPRWIHHVSSL
jgi:reversibly glycosylated polypeptide / UDP-arabinopyranose mutase